MPSTNPPSRHSMKLPGKAPMSGRVPVPTTGDTLDNQKKLIAIAIVLGVILLVLLLLLFADGVGGGSGGVGTGVGSGIGDGSGSADAGTGNHGGIGHSDDDGTTGNDFKDGIGTSFEHEEKQSEQSVNIALTENATEPTLTVEGESLELNASALEEPPFDEWKTTGSTNSLSSLSNESNGGGSVGKGGGGGVTVRVFGVGGEGTRFMYVFDRSSSMNGHKLQEVKKELSESLSALNNNHRFNIIFYNRLVRKHEVSKNSKIGIV